MFARRVRTHLIDTLSHRERPKETLEAAPRRMLRIRRPMSLPANRASHSDAVDDKTIAPQGKGCQLGVRKKFTAVATVHDVIDRSRILDAKFAGHAHRIGRHGRNINSKICGTAGLTPFRSEQRINSED